VLSDETFPHHQPDQPQLGLVCLSSDERIKYRGMTRATFLKTPPHLRRKLLLSVYWDNTHRLLRALDYCANRDIRLYRTTSNLYPMSDEPLGRDVLSSIPATMSSVGRRARKHDIRLILHPDQFVVLNSETRQTRATSVKIMQKHAMWFDLYGLEQSPWNLMNIHGGKSGRVETLVRAVDRLPDNVRSRLTFENDEYSCSTVEILEVSQRTGCPMVFDCHHHVIKEGLDSYDDPSVAEATHAARETWPDSGWQVCHVSNGDAAFRDRYHAEFARMMPRAFREVPWLEVESRGKERAIRELRESWPTSGDPPPDMPLRKPTAAEMRERDAAEEASVAVEA
jgi:UV DNA damage endonuclease